MSLDSLIILFIFILLLDDLVKMSNDQNDDEINDQIDDQNPNQDGSSISNVPSGMC